MFNRYTPMTDEQTDAMIAEYQERADDHEKMKMKETYRTGYTDGYEAAIDDVMLMTVSCKTLQDEMTMFDYIQYHIDMLNQLLHEDYMNVLTDDIPEIDHKHFSKMLGGE